MARHVGTVVGVARTTVPGFADLPAIEVDVAIYEPVFGGRYDLTTIPSSKATVHAVHESIIALHDVLVPGDTFVFAYSVTVPSDRGSA